MTEEYILGAGLLKLPGICRFARNSINKKVDGKTEFFKEEPKFGYQTKRRYSESLAKGC